MSKSESFKFSLKNGNQIIVRHLDPDDAESFLQFRMQVPHESVHTMQYIGMKFPNLDEMRERLKKQVDDKYTLNIAAFHKGRVIGQLNLRMPHADHPWAQHLGQFGMMILKDNWGQGLGKFLLQIQDEYAKTIGVTRIEAMVRTKNVRGVRLYESCGYQIEGTRVNAAKINDEFCDEYFIAKIL